MKKFYSIAFIAALIMVPLYFFSCTTTIDLSMTSVQEEGGIKFIQVTEEGESILGPGVSVNGNNIGWDTRTYLSISPDNQRLAYIGSTTVNGMRQSNIFIRDANTGKSTIQRTFKNSVLSPAFSRDGKYLAFEDNSEGESNIYLINSKEGMGTQQITTSSSNETQPQFSKNGQNIFFVKENSSSQMVNGVVKTIKNYNIWGYNRNTSVLTQYSEGLNPSPIDSGKILITRNNKLTGKGEIWILDIVSGTETQVFSESRMAFSNPSISPDHKKILLVGSTPASKNNSSNLNIYTVNVDGSELTQLTYHPGVDCSPIWSADGKSIYFISERGNKNRRYQIWRMEYKNTL